MEYEPVKPIKALASSPLAKSPTRKPLQEIMSTPTNSNSSVLREKESVPKTKKLTKKERLATTVETFADFNLKCFDDLLPADMSVSWNNRLRTTAGVTKMKTKRLSDGKENVRVASIELSEKVVDDVERLRATLLHEMCHAAAWLVDAQKKPPHGPAFWKWASIAGARSGGYLVTTCHNYEVHRPFKWQCATPTCGIEYTRHSKKGIDPLRHRCGKCRGRIEFVGAFNADMTPKKTRAATGFSLFVQEHFANVKTSLKKKGKTSAHQSVMQELSRLYAISKGSASKASGD
jgi:predicted SprT family Zn-dependent metalloprotease